MPSQVAIGECTDRCLTWTPEQNNPHGKFTYIDIASIDRDAKRICSPAVMAYAEAPSRARQLVKSGDILVSTVRPNLNGVALVPAELDGAIASTGYTVLRPRQDKVEGRYLFHWVKSKKFVDEMTRLATGASYPAVSDKIVRESRIPLPSLPEQRRIAAILDTADALRAKRREAIAKLEQLLHSVFLDMFGNPVKNPKGWPQVPFTKIGEWKSGATPSKSESSYWDGSFPWVSPKDMKVDLIADAQDHVSELAFKNTNLKVIDSGHLLIVVRGMILAHSFPVAVNTVPVAINQDMKAIKPKKDVDVVYLKAVVNALKPRILSVVSTAGHGTRRLDTRDASEVLIPVPPSSLQQKFRKFVEVSSKVRMGFATQLARENQLFESIQQRAFSGTL